MEPRAQWLIDTVLASSGTMRASLIPSLSSLDSVPAAVSDLIPTLLADSDYSVQQATVQLLIDLGVPPYEYLPRLKTLTSSASEDVRRCVATYLIQPVDPNPELLDLLRLLFEDASERVRLSVAIRLCQVDPDSRAEELFLRILREAEDPFDRAIAVAGLAHSNPLTPNLQAVILNSLDDPHPVVILNAIDTIIDHQIFTGSHRAKIERYRSHPDYLVRSAVAEFFKASS
jgi:HEAT repeat protein